VDDYANSVGNVPWIIGGSGSESLREAVEHAGGMVVAGRNLGDLRTTLAKTGKSHSRS
jgi:hypothetical protein